MLEAVDLTREGKKLSPPTAEHPTYYLPVYLGYKERGGVEQSYQRKPPSEVEIRRQLAAMLAKQHYLLAPKGGSPTIVLVIEWGSIVPTKVGDGRGGIITNASEIRAYVAGDSARDLDRHGAYYTEISSLEPRHFLLISAFQYLAARDQKKEILLWRAHVTTGLWGNYLDEVIPTMIAHAGPILGKPMQPGAAWIPSKGRVIIGTPEVVDDNATLMKADEKKGSGGERK